MKKLLVFVALIITLKSSAQDVPAQKNVNSFGLSLGLMKLSFVDELNSPLIYRSQPKTVQLAYERTGSKAITRGGLLAGRGSLLPADYQERMIYGTSYDEEGNAVKDSFMLGGSLLTAKLFLHHLRQIKATEKWQLHIGGGLNQQLYYPDGFVRSGYINAFTLTVNGNLSYLISPKSKISGTVSIPLVAYNSRFPYHSTLSHPEDSEVKMFFKQGSELTSLHEFQQIEAALQYKYTLSQRWEVAVNYQFNLFNYENPKPIKLFSNHLQAGVNYKF